jgi:CheY-like chemotaxis protein
VLKVQNNESISDKEIFTDHRYLEQIFSNLLSNAIKFTHEGEITFGLESIRDNLFTFYVKDTGIGIGKEEQENIFIRFRKAEDKSKRLYREGGLGLSISKYLTEFLGGSIVLESEIDKGSLFRFSIMNSYSSTETENKILFGKNNKIEQPPNLSGRTVLIVEDEVSNFELLDLFLKKTHITIIWAKDGLEAIKFFAENKEDIDVVLMDIKLPKMSGYEASEKIKEIDSSVPIIAQTAYALTSEIQKYKGNIINDYVIKPIDKVELYTKICQWLDKGCPP